MSTVQPPAIRILRPNLEATFEDGVLRICLGQRRADEFAPPRFEQPWDATSPINLDVDPFRRHFAGLGLAAPEERVERIVHEDLATLGEDLRKAFLRALWRRRRGILWTATHRLRWEENDPRDDEHVIEHDDRVCVVPIAAELEGLHGADAPAYTDEDWSECTGPTYVRVVLGTGFAWARPTQLPDTFDDLRVVDPIRVDTIGEA